MKEIQTPKAVVWWTQIEPLNFDWLTKNPSILDWFENFTTQTRRELKFSIFFIEFGHRMEKLQHFELDLKLCEGTFGPLALLEINFHASILKPYGYNSIW